MERIHNEKWPQTLLEDSRGRKKSMSADKPKKLNKLKHSEESLHGRSTMSAYGECLPKKIERLNSGTEKIREGDKINIIDQLRREYKLMMLLSYADIPGSTFYYYIKKMNKPDKYADIKKLIKHIYHENKGRYGYRIITLDLKNRGCHINHKTVLKLMHECSLKCRIRIPKYRFYKGDVRRVSSNILQRDFKTNKPNSKWVTHVTEFSLFGNKLYLSPILDLYNREIISHSVFGSLCFQLVTEMLDKAFSKIPNELKGLPPVQFRIQSSIRS